MNNVLGSRSNITFLGRGKAPDPFIDEASTINMEAAATLGKDKLLKELENSMGYLTAGKLNDVQAGRLFENLNKLDGLFNPKQVSNITDLGTGIRNLDQEGIASLRAEQKLADDLVKDVSDMELDIRSQFPKASDDQIRALVNKAEAEVPKRPANFDELSLDDRRLVDLEAENIYQGILKESDLAALNRPESPTVRGAAREFLNEMLNIDDPVMRTSLADVIDATDLKYITEGGGGLAGDPIILIEKYFGSRIASQLPKTGNPEDIKVFAQRVTNNVVDGAGRRPTDPRFDKETAVFTDVTDIPFAKGGLAKILEV